MRCLGVRQRWLENVGDIFYVEIGERVEELGYKNI